MPADTPPDASVSPKPDDARTAALESLTRVATANIPGAAFASITTYGKDRALRTLAPTDPLAGRLDLVQYELGEGPCYAAVTQARFVLINDMATSTEFPRYARRAAELGVGSQTAIQLVDGEQRAGLNLYARTAGAFDQATVQFADLFAGQAAALLGHAEQVDQLSQALHTRTDIGTAIGILMERFRIDSGQAFAFLSRHSQNRNIKLRILARDVIDGTFESTALEDGAPRTGPDPPGRTGRRDRPYGG